MKLFYAHFLNKKTGERFERAILGESMKVAYSKAVQHIDAEPNVEIKLLEAEIEVVL